MPFYGMLIVAAFGFSIPGAVVAADDGSKVFAESCTPCHTTKVRPLDNVHLTKEQWKEAVDRMIEQGAEVPRGKMPELLDYLSRTRGPAGAAVVSGNK